MAATESPVSPSVRPPASPEKASFLDDRLSSSRRVFGDVVKNFRRRQPTRFIAKLFVVLRREV